MPNEIEPMRLENLETWKTQKKFPFWVEGSLVMIFSGVGAGCQDWGGVVEAGGAMAGSQMGQGVGARSARWQAREGMAGTGGPDGNCWG